MNLLAMEGRFYGPVMRYVRASTMKGLLFFICFCYPSSSWSESVCPPGKNISGTYYSDKGKDHLPSKIVLHRKKTNKTTYHFDLESYWSARANDDGSATSQAVYSGDLEVNGCYGKYYSNEDDCLLNFDLKKNTITISHSGACMYIGHNASPNGVYIRAVGSSNE